MYSKKLLKRFIKDYSLPIQVVQEPYFSYFIELYNQQFDTKNKLMMLDDAIKQTGSDEKFLEAYYQIRDKIITDIESTAAYTNYNTMDMTKYNVPNKGYPSKDVYSLCNRGHVFISIDLKKANFQALKFCDPSIVLNCESYQDLIGKFTDIAYMKESKYLRQVIFGNMNPKRQVKIERFIIQIILDFLLNTNRADENSIRSVSNDEIVLELQSAEEMMCFKQYSSELAGVIKKELGFDVDIEIYALDSIGNSSYFTKHYLNKPGFDFACVPLVYFAQIFKKALGMDITENDLVFFYENQLCNFKKPLNFENEKEMEEDAC